MQVITNVTEFKELPGGCAVTIGNFDGVHIGHQKLIARAVTVGRKRGYKSVVITFDPHPLRVLVGPHTPPAITRTDHKLDLLADLGPDYTLVLPFTRELAALPPEEFVRRYLVEGLNTRDLIIGYDYAFGKGRRGNFELLSQLGRAYGFGVERLDPVLFDGAVVSSTRIRDMVMAGKVWETRDLLGRYYTVSGTVIHGRGRGGKLLGFPTANLQVLDKLCPRSGVYAVWGQRNGHTIPGVANIGTNPTFGDVGLSLEVHFFDFTEDLYDQKIRIHFVQRLRSEKKFESVQALKSQIADDIALGRRILASQEARP